MHKLHQSKYNTEKKLWKVLCHTARLVVMSLKIELTIADLLSRTPDPPFLGQCAIDLARELRRSHEIGTPNAWDDIEDIFVDAMAMVLLLPSAST